MYRKLLSFINRHKLLYSFQFGFRRGNSPDLALLCLVDRISNALENGEYVLGLFLDFCMAFDIVNHDILFTKLECLGIHDIPLKWLKSYLSYRDQYVICNKTVYCEVSQGSILGRLLFNVLANVSNVLFSLLFTDDSNMFVSDKNPDELVKIMKAWMTKVVNWFRTNKLSLNLKKKCHISLKKGVKLRYRMT